MSALAQFLPPPEAPRGTRLQALEAHAYRALRELMREVGYAEADGQAARVCVPLRRGALKQALAWEAEAMLFELGIEAPSNENEEAP